MWLFFVVPGALMIVSPLLRRALAKALNLSPREYVTPSGQRLARFQRRYEWFFSLGAGLGFAGLGLAQRFYPALALPSVLLVLIVSAVQLIGYLAIVYAPKPR